MKRIAVVHYMPLEFYPPVTNFLDILGSRKNVRVKAFSTKNNKNRKEYHNENLQGIERGPFPNTVDSGFKRIKKYLKFNFQCFRSLIKFNPSEIIYFESYSAGPVYWYLKFFGKNTKLKIHYHEYSSPGWYENGMRLVKIYHSYERNNLYAKADWISHTNLERINLFLKDHPEVKPAKVQVLPNYPPQSWSTNKLYANGTGSVIKTVYLGSLSLKATYIKEYCDWVIKQKGKVSFDIYSFNLHKDTEQFLENLSSEHITFFKKGVEYEEIPMVLNKYDVGVILYKDYSANVRHCAPNKLFEYMASGLEVWFSNKLKGCFSYQKMSSPRILPVDFQEIDEQLPFKKNSSSTVPHEPFYAEMALKPLIKELSR